MKYVIATLLMLVPLVACSESDGYAVSIRGVKVDVEIADTLESRTTGLMFREDLPENAGMLFVFDEEAPRAFYMKNTSIPLSIAYIDSRFVIREIHDMEPFSLESIFSRYPAMYALEVNQGAFQRWGIEPGDRLELSESLASRLK
jgi:uncharacterized membrane protein (UPF0127 family)